MTRDEFMDKLERELAARRVPEPEDILAEYRRHFEYKLADGYSEEETAARLGDPAELAAQFEPGEAESGSGRGGSAARSALTWTGLIFADMFVLSFFAVFASWVLAVACTLGGHALMTYLLGFVSADVVSFALLAEPIGAAVWALLLFHEKVTPPLMIGGLTVIVGLMLYTYGEMKAGKR